MFFFRHIVKRGNQLKHPDRKPRSHSSLEDSKEHEFHFMLKWRDSLGPLLSFFGGPLSRLRGLPGGSDGKDCACNAGHPGLIPGLGRSTGEGDGNPLQYSCLENSMDRGAWRATVHGFTKSQTQLSN